MFVLVVVRFLELKTARLYSPESFHPPEPKKLIESIRDAAEGGPKNLWVICEDRKKLSQEIQKSSRILSRYAGIHAVAFPTSIRCHVEVKRVARGRR